MGVLGKFSKQAFSKGIEKAKQFFHKKENNVTHPPKEQEALQKPAVKELNQESLAQATKEGKVLQDKGVTTESTHTTPPAKATGGDDTSGQFRAVEKDKPAYNPNLYDARAKAKENDKGLSR